MPDNAESTIQEKKNGKNDFYLFGQVIEPLIKKYPEPKQNKHRSYCNDKYFIEFAHLVL